jgi:Fe-S oxidoreductase
VRDYFMNVYNWGNPYKKRPEERGRWADGLGVPRFEGQEYLFFTGDEGSFDEKGIAMARSVASLLLKAGVSFGILPEEELSDGNDVLAAGEKDLFAHLAEKNSDVFIRRGVKKIITLSPHSYNAIKNHYPRAKGPMEVFHYTHLLSGLAKGLGLKKYGKRVTYHDPCYLGRWNGDYWPARIALAAVPGIRVAEMDRSMANALCCGGGGGNFHTDILGSGETSAARTRVREAMDAGAEVLAVACPVCLKMLDDAVKDEGAGTALAVTDISGILSEAMG